MFHYIKRINKLTKVDSYKRKINRNPSLRNQSTKISSCSVRLRFVRGYFSDKKEKKCNYTVSILFPWCSPPRSLPFLAKGCLVIARSPLNCLLTRRAPCGLSAAPFTGISSEWNERDITPLLLLSLKHRQYEISHVLQLIRIITKNWPIWILFRS